MHQEFWVAGRGWTVYFNLSHEEHVELVDSASGIAWGASSFEASSTPARHSLRTLVQRGRYNQEEAVVQHEVGRAIELLDDAPNAKSFNATVREWLRDEIAGYYGCLSSAPQGDFSGELEIEWRANPWIVVREIYQADCGGAHPSRGGAYWVWNLAERKRIEPWNWIVTIGKSEDCPYRGGPPPPPDELNNLIVAAATRNKTATSAATA